MRDLLSIPGDVVQWIFNWYVAPIPGLEDPLFIALQYFIFLMTGTIFGYLSMFQEFRKKGFVMLPKYNGSFIGSGIKGALIEVIFRGIPMLIAIWMNTSAIVGLFVGSIIYMIFEDKHQDIYSVFAGFFFIKLFLADLWWLAIIIHSLHNMIAHIYSKYTSSSRENMETRMIDGYEYYHLSTTNDMSDEKIKELEDNENIEVID